jgi:hypothetical protein
MEDITWLRELTGRALFKIAQMQNEDPNSVPAELESLVFSLADWLGIREEIEEGLRKRMVQ